MRIARIPLLAILALLPTFLLAGETATSRLLQTDFTRVNRTSQLPAGVLAAVSEMLGGKTLADPPYLLKATDSRLEGPRLLFAGKSSSIWFVHFALNSSPARYELGIFEVQPGGDVVTLGHLVSTTHAWSTPNLKNMIRRGEFTEIRRP